MAGGTEKALAGMEKARTGMKEPRAGIEEALAGTVTSGISTSMTLPCGVAVIGPTDGTPVTSAGGGSSPEDGISIRLPSILIQIRTFLRL